MVVIKGEIVATTTIKNRRISKTVLSLNEGDEALNRLRLYLNPLVNEFVKRRVLPGVDSDGTVKCRVKIRESKRAQTVTIEQIRI